MEQINNPTSNLYIDALERTRYINKKLQEFPLIKKRYNL